MFELVQRSGRRMELPAERRAALVADLGAVVERHNPATDGSLRIEAEYSLVVARKRG